MKKSASKYFITATKMDLALISLLKKKPIEYITVSELCQTAGVTLLRNGKYPEATEVLLK